MARSALGGCAGQAISAPGLVLLLAAGAGAQEGPLDWRSGDEYLSEDLQDWETIYPDTLIGLTDEAAEGALGVQVVSDGSQHLGLCRRLPDLDLEFERLERVVCYVRCSQPSNGYIRLGTGPSPWFDHWGFSNLRFATDRWTRLDLLPQEQRLAVDGVFCRTEMVSDGTFEPSMCQYLAVFNTYSQQAGDFLIVDGVDFTPEDPWWYCGEHGAELQANQPGDPRGPYTGRLVARRGGPLWIGLRGTTEQFAQARKLQFLVKTSRRAKTQLILSSGLAPDDKLLSGLWEQERERYVLVEYVPGGTGVQVDGREVAVTARDGFRPDRIDRLMVAWSDQCDLGDAMSVEGLVFVSKDGTAGPAG